MPTISCHIDAMLLPSLSWERCTFIRSESGRDQESGTNLVLFNQFGSVFDVISRMFRFILKLPDVFTFLRRLHFRFPGAFIFYSPSTK